MPLSLSPQQKGTISREAVEFLSKANTVTKEALSDAFAARRIFQSAEDSVEEDLIRRFELQVEKTTVGNVPVVIIHPLLVKPKNEGKLVFNIHGGGFVMGTGRERTALMTAAEMGITVYSVEYALSPEAVYPFAIEQCLSVYRQLIGKFGHQNIAGFSSSAGGQIMLSTIVRAQREQLPLPAVLAFYTPSVDLSPQGDSSVSNDGRDLISTSAAVEGFGRVYAGEVDPADSLLSPIHADLCNALPPTVINTGTRDVLLSQCVRLYWKLRDAGGRVELLVSEGMWHGFNWEVDLPEGTRARNAVYNFVEAGFDTK